MKVGDLVKLSLRGYQATGLIKVTDRVGIVVDDNICDWLVLVRWFATGRTSETHVDFIEPLEEQ
tara:strand:- start:23 stop:214 length:192 start_codon:yes stop_codon:yes gene_type:complete